MSIYSILDQIRETSTSEKVKGDKFEKLMLKFFQIEPTYKLQFKNVWLWNEWPLNKGRPDTGIDLVAENSDGNGFTAIQCKNYAPHVTLNKEDIDSFFNESGKKPFTHRIIVSTTSNWSINAENSLNDQDKPTRRIGIESLANSEIDWGRFDLNNPTDLSLLDRKVARPHQVDAINSVIKGFSHSDRGKLIMACGTGKTFTSQCIAEKIAGEGKTVVVLVPSISLLSQTVKDWTADSNIPIEVYAVCSDSMAGRRRDNEDAAPYDLAIPATTNVDVLVERFKANKSKSKMSVILSTYQSISIIAEAQKKGLGEISLIIADEAHRTTGKTLSGDDDSHFTKVHDDKVIKAQKRLYMTATPRMYGEVAKVKAASVDAVLASMDDEEIYGVEFYRIDFYEAVQRGLLTDYKVIVLAVNEDAIVEAFQRQLSDENNELKLDDITRIIGCLNAFSKIDPGGKYFINDTTPMKRVVAFSNTIANSKKFKELFEQVSTKFNSYTGIVSPLNVVVDHVDGSYNSLKREELLGWLKQDPADSFCSVLSNAKCLTEGVDVPALDGIVFLEPRNSVVDVVQAVGRVMRRNIDKKYGYVILPIGIPAGVTPETALSDNKRYATVWQVLNALRSHDKRIEAVIKRIELNNETPDMIEVIPVGFADKSIEPGEEKEKLKAFQTEFPLEEIRAAIYAKMVEKVGTKQYWENWATDVAQIADRHVEQINNLLSSPNSKVSMAFKKFLQGLKGNLNESITRNDAIEMLAQHLITKPIFDAIFGDYRFAEQNPVSKVMQETIELIEDKLQDVDRKTLENFYTNVSERVEGIDNLVGKQRVITELYEKFFKIAFRKTTEKLGIVYTPIEIVDFIINSVAEITEKEFNSKLSDKNVHILDPFTGTGTFIARLLENKVFDQQSLTYKYANEIHANEIVLLAYYIAAVNIESTYQTISKVKKYSPFEGIVLTDTFQMYEENDAMDYEVFKNNNDRVLKLRSQPIKIIMGNPPYSVGQDSQNDNNKNMDYPKLDSEIAATYAKASKSTSAKQVFDSYIRAFKWATQRLGETGIVAFVTNGSFIDAKSMDGFRHHLGKDFQKIYVFNLRGNQRTQGEMSRREGGKIFGEGSRTSVAITFLIKNSNIKKTDIYYSELPDYLDRDSKLKMIKEYGSVSSVNFKKIKPDENNDWINQVDLELLKYDAMGDKKDVKGTAIFSKYGVGLVSARDSWVYNFSKEELQKNIGVLIKSYNSYIKEFKSLYSKNKPTQKQIDEFISSHSNSKEISWDSTLLRDFGKGLKLEVSKEYVRTALYRPFAKKYIYFDQSLNRGIGSMPSFFASEKSKNLAIAINVNALKPFGALMTDQICDFHLLGDTQVFPLYIYPDKEPQGSLFADETNNNSAKLNIADSTIKRYQAKYGKAVTGEDIFYYCYGLLHSPQYLDKFKTELTKFLPRIPMVEEFTEFSDIGRKLGSLHVNYENAEIFDFGAALDKELAKVPVRKIRYSKSKGKSDYSKLILNEKYVLEGIPVEVQDYKISGRSALDWVIDRYEVKEDSASGIIQDPNKWSSNEPYIMNLIGKVVTVSIESVKLINQLPDFD